MCPPSLSPLAASTPFSIPFFLSLPSPQTPTLIQPETFLFFAVNFIALTILLPRYPSIPWAIIQTLIGIIVGMTSGKEGAVFYSLTTLEKKYGELSLQVGVGWVSECGSIQ